MLLWGCCNFCYLMVYVALFIGWIYLIGGIGGMGASLTTPLGWSWFIFCYFGALMYIFYPSIIGVFSNLMCLD